MKRIYVFLISLIFAVDAFCVPVRLMDITSLSGMITNHLVGYGIVVGLNGTGDRGADYATVSSVVNMLQKLGVRVPLDMIETRNCAAVIVTATLPASCEEGEHIDVSVASIGNARSIYGGTLLMTPLKAGNGEICAIAQGTVNVGGHNFEVNNNSVSKNSPTSGFIAGGATIQKRIEADFISNTEIVIYTQRNDFVLADNIIKEIDAKFGAGTASTNDGKAIRIKVPDTYASSKSVFIAEISSLTVDDKGEPIVVLDERTGTVVMGSEIVVDDVAISHGNLHVSVASKNVISQPNPFSSGTTIQSIDSDMTVQEQRAKFTSVKKGVTLADVVKNLNSMGVSADDIIAIITDMKVAGAIKGKVIVK